MNNLIMLPKENNEIPSNWGIIIQYYDGTKEQFDIVMHTINNGLLTFITKDDEHKMRVLDKIKGIDLDKRFSKFFALKQEQEAKPNG